MSSRSRSAGDIPARAACADPATASHDHSIHAHHEEGAGNAAPPQRDGHLSHPRASFEIRNIQPAATFDIGLPYQLVGVTCPHTLRAVDLKAFTTPWPVEKFQRLLEAPHVDAKLAVAPWGSLGYFMVEHGVERFNADYLTSLGVVPAAQGKKVGERLFLEAVKNSRDSGAPALWLHVDVTNHGAQRLYEKYGFERAGLLPDNYPEEGHDGYEMVLHDLQSPQVASRLAELESRLDAAIRGSRPYPSERHTI